MRFNEIRDALPKSWADIKLRDYQRLVEIEEITDDGVGGVLLDVMMDFKIISTLTGCPIDVLERLPKRQYQELQDIIRFISTPPQRNKKTSIKVKKLEEVTYSDYVLMVQLGENPFPHMHTILRSYTYKSRTFDRGEHHCEPYTTEEVLDFGMDDVTSIFFFLRRYTRKSLNSMTRSSALRLAKLRVRERLSRSRTR